jgi:hypothetical protein
MAKTNVAPFAQTLQTAVVATGTAVVGLATDAPTGITQLLQAGPEGAILTRLSGIPRGQVSGTGLLLFIAKSMDNYATIRLIDSETMPAYIESVSTGYPETQFLLYSEQFPLRLAAGDRLFVGLKAATAVPVTFKAEYSDF